MLYFKSICLAVICSINIPFLNAHPFRLSRDWNDSASFELSAELFQSSGESNADAFTVESQSANKSLHEDASLRDILCPNKPELRYDLRAGLCAEVNSQAHCGTNMVFLEEPESSSYGYCECDFENQEIPLVFHPSSNSCYPVYTQAYCKPGFWLVLSKEAKGPICTKNVCQQDQRSTRPKLGLPWVWESVRESKSDPVIRLKDVRDNVSNFENSLLVPLNGSGPCLPLGRESTACDAKEKIIISQDDFLPRCGTQGKWARRLFIIANACPPGSFYSIIGYCQPVWDF